MALLILGTPKSLNGIKYAFRTKLYFFPVIFTKNHLYLIVFQIKSQFVSLSYSIPMIKLDGNSNLGMQFGLAGHKQVGLCLIDSRPI